jgi:ATP-dependent Clp protease adaptor protein ClpS
MPVVQITPFPVIIKQRIRYTRPTMKASRLPHYKLVLHRDPSFDHKYVASVVHKTIDDMSFEEACDKTSEAYLLGKSLLRVCPQEQAEDYCEKIRDKKLMATVEAVGMF